MKSLRQTYILRVWNGALPPGALAPAAPPTTHGAIVEGPYGAPVDAPTGAVEGMVTGERTDEPANWAHGEAEGAEGSETPNRSAAPDPASEGAIENTVKSASEGAEDVAALTNTGRFYCSLQAVASEEIHYFSTLEETMRFLRNNALAFRFKRI